MRIKVMSNLYGLEKIKRKDAAIDHVRYPRSRVSSTELASIMWRSLWVDYVLINCSPNDLFLFCILKTLCPFSRCRIISQDTVLPVPRARSLRDKAKLWIKKILFKRVHIFIEYFKDTQGYETYYGMPRERFRYVPFKINRYERVLQTPVRDDGYIFCGGNTRRDFRTLFEAANKLSYPIKLVTMKDEVLMESGSELDERELPKNIEVVRHDGSDTFIDYIAASRLVVLPIKKENISASGIGVYLASMALGKCVIISEGPAVNGVLPEMAAVIVPVEDSSALCEAMRKVYEDNEYRQQVAETGKRYALSLEGEDRLCESVMDVIHKDRSAAIGRNR